MEKNKNNEINFDKSICENIKDYASCGMIPFHMPGHKRNLRDFPYLNEISAELDITEIVGFDNLHDAKGMLKDSMERASRLWGSKFSRFLVNGSTGGILAAIGALTHRGDTVLVARNCHKSVYSAIELFGLKPIYLCPPIIEDFGFYGSVSAKSVSAAFENNFDIKLVVVTSPTYDGIISDIKSISDIAHAHGARVFVDEAHGAHLGLSPYFCGGAVQGGADIVVESLHKTLPSLTQSAILHVVGSAVSEVEIDKKLAMLQTSSPSYLLLSSIDALVRYLESYKDKIFDEYHNRLLKLHNALDKLSVLQIFNPFDKNIEGVFMCDASKIIIHAKGQLCGLSEVNVSCYSGVAENTLSSLSGIALQKLFREKYKIEAEMATSEYVLLMSSIADTTDSFNRLTAAILDIDANIKESVSAVDFYIERGNYKKEQGSVTALRLPKAEMYSFEACEMRHELVRIDEASGLVSAEYIWAYPPGCPLVVPGEILSNESLDFVLSEIKNGVNIASTYKMLPEFVGVVKI